VVVAPTHDRTSYPEQVEATLERAPHALVSLLDSGHYPWIDDPRTFLDLLHEAMAADLPRGAGGRAPSEGAH
jgi:proline iminopeptidase